MQAIAAVSADSLRRYPNPTADAFRDAAATAARVVERHIIAGNGSDDILTIATRRLCRPAERWRFPIRLIRSIRCWPGWRMPSRWRCRGIRIGRCRSRHCCEPAPMRFIWPIPTPHRHLCAAGAGGGTGRQFPGLLLVDEAYADFAGDNCLQLVARFENVVISRTLSKAYSLAGLRFGYAVARPQVIAEMMKVKDSYNCDALAIAAATAAISDQAYAQWTWQHIRAERQRVTTELTRRALPCCPARPILCWRRFPAATAGKCTWAKTPGHSGAIF